MTGCQPGNRDAPWALPFQSHPLIAILQEEQVRGGKIKGLHSTGARNALWYMLADAGLLSVAGVDGWHFRGLQEGLAELSSTSTSHTVQTLGRLLLMETCGCFSPTCTPERA